MVAAHIIQELDGHIISVKTRFSVQYVSNQSINLADIK